MTMRNKTGFILIFALVIIVLIVFSLLALSFIAYNDLRLSTAASKGMKAYYLAEAGIAKGFITLRGYATIPATPFSVPSDTITFSTGDTGTFTITVDSVASTSLPNYKITSTGTYKGVSRQISFTVAQSTFPCFSYVSDSEDSFYWGSPIWFVTGDVLNGPVRSNDQFNISGNPIFMGDVTSSASSINYMHGGPPQDNPDFRGRLTFNAPKLQMPNQADVVGQVAAAAQAGGLSYNKNITVYLHDGKMDITPKNESTQPNVSIPTNGALYADGTVTIHGILTGTLTVAATGNIYVSDSIIYHTSPWSPPGSTDMLCLASGYDISVTSSAYDVEIDAYLIAYHSFGVDNYAYIPPRGTLTLYGGVTQDVRGGVGTFYSSNNQKASGYTKNYNFDTRLALMVPTFFPPLRDDTNRIVYTKVMWKEA